MEMEKIHKDKKKLELRWWYRSFEKFNITREVIFIHSFQYN
jgi:hypothetical protein